jgi:dipeptidyl aminopeptidase/acylaminoacyl peptidase
VLAALMEHESSTITERRYVHLFDRQRTDEGVRRAIALDVRFTLYGGIDSFLPPVQTRAVTRIRVGTWRVASLLLALAVLVTLSAGLGRASRPKPSGLIAFDVVIEGDKGIGDSASIWTIASDGSRLSRLTPFSEGVGAPAWSPNGRKIAYERLQDSVYVMNADGSGQHRLVRGGPLSYPKAPRWSPDGKRIVYRSCDGQRCALRIVSADGGQPRTLIASSASGPVTDFSDPDWSPDGKQIAFGGQPMYVINRDGKGLRKLPKTWGDHVRWSPDGRKLLFIGGGPGPGGLFVMNADGTGVHRYDLKYINAADWSPDGREIAYAASAEPMRILTLKDGSVRAVPRTGSEIDVLDWRAPAGLPPAAPPPLRLDSGRLTVYGRTIWNLEALLHDVYPRHAAVCLVDDFDYYRFVLPRVGSCVPPARKYLFHFANARHSAFRVVARRSSPLGTGFYAPNARPVRIGSKYVYCGRELWLALPIPPPASGPIACVGP